MSDIDFSSPVAFLKTMRLSNYENAKDFFYDMNEQIEKIEKQLELQNKIIEVLEKSNEFYQDTVNFGWYMTDELGKRDYHLKDDVTSIARQAKEDVEKLIGGKWV